MHFLKGVSIALYLISFVLPVFSGSDVIGLEAFIFGALAGYIIPWLANTFYFLNFAFKSKQAKIILVSLAILSALMTFPIKEINTEIEFDTHTKVSPGIGFYAWISSFILLAISNYLLNKKSQELS